MSERKSWIGCDLDGTLAFYNGWVGPGDIGEPIPAMQDRVKNWIKDGFDVRIMTARVAADSPGRDVAIIAIMKWTQKHLGKMLPCTASKDLDMICLWDDRAIQVIPNTGLRSDGLD